MRMGLVKKLTIVCASVALAAQVFGFYAPPKAAAFNASNVVSDSVFENTGSMSAAQIDSFLNNIGTSCIRSASGFMMPDPQGFNGSGYAFGGNVTAGQAIYDISNHYHINPQVLISQIQKEQSIITGGAGCHYDKPNPTDPAQVFACDLYGNGKLYRCTQACPWSYGGGCMNIAVSYGCPGNCNVDDELIQVQISGASWVMRFDEERAYGLLTGYAGYDSGDENYWYSGPMTPGYRQRISGGTNAYYDGSWTTSDGVSVNISNGATASMYTYTPFANGNQEFTTDFENFGFGDPSTGSCVGNEPPLTYVERYYNPRTFEHWYSAYSCDQGFLTNLGYVLEGPVFNTTPSTASWAVPVYRYYNPATHQHMWTTDNETAQQLAAGGTGYQIEAGIVFYSVQCSMPNVHQVVRFYNPKTYLHFWAGDPSAQDISFLSSQAGYYEEGTAFCTQ